MESSFPFSTSLFTVLLVPSQFLLPDGQTDRISGKFMDEEENVEEQEAEDARSIN